MLEALVARQRTGEGALIRVSLFDATAEWMAVPLIHFEYGGRAPERMGLGASLGRALWPVCRRRRQGDPDRDPERARMAAFLRRDPRRCGARPTTRASATTTDGSSTAPRSTRWSPPSSPGIRATTLAERLKSAEIAFGNFNTVEDFSHHPHLRRIAVGTPEGAVRAARRSGRIRRGAEPGPRPGSRRAHRLGAGRICAMSAAYLARRDPAGDLRDDFAEAYPTGSPGSAPSAAVVLCYAASFALLGLALRGIELSIAYAVWSGVGTAVVAAIGIVWFGESAAVCEAAVPCADRTRGRRAAPVDSAS